MHLTPRRLLELAGFSVFTPRRVPEGWDATLSFAETVDYEWREPNEDWQPARVRLVRDGTRIVIDSASLSAAELLELARTMIPLRDVAPDFGGSDEPAHER